MMEKPDELKESLRNFFSFQNFAVLATCDGVKPHASLMSVVVTDDLENILFVTEQPSRKHSNILKNVEVALLFDNRSNMGAEDVAQARAVTVLGKALTVTENEKQWFLDLYRAKHPHLESFVTASSSVCFKVLVESYLVVSRFQDVVELQMVRG